MRFNRFGVVLSASLFAIACGPDCVSMCQQAQEDGDCYEDASGDDRDCEALCEDVEEIVAEDNGDCEEDLDELLDCMSEEDNACRAVTDGSCTDENSQLYDCIGDYCLDNPTNDACEDLLDISIRPTQ